MRALTLWNPWAQIVARGHKLIENRPWRPPEWMIGERFAIHAGQKWDRERFDLINSLYRSTHGRSITREECVFGAIIATASIPYVVTSANQLPYCSLPEGQGQWFFGPVGWVLSDVRKVSPPAGVPCRGYQKLWRLDNNTRAAVLSGEVNP